jgi:pyruvate/2-oxoglutarate dehydrogenase complex dihydrolipoamide acyltransferase (E2) component
MPRPNSNAPARATAALTRLLALAALLAASAMLVSCGGSKSPAASAASEQATEREAEVKLAKFAKCMREHGVEAKTSSGNGHQSLGIRVKGNGGPGPQTLEAAQRACKQYQPAPKKEANLSPKERVEHEEAVQKFAKCMREHGIDVHASTSSGGGGVQLQVGGPRGGAPNPESPAFGAAQKACQSLLPFKRRGAPGGPTTSKSSVGGEHGAGAALGIGR